MLWDDLVVDHEFCSVYLFGNVPIGFGKKNYF